MSLWCIAHGYVPFPASEIMRKLFLIDRAAFSGSSCHVSPRHPLIGLVRCSDGKGRRELSHLKLGEVAMKSGKPYS